MRFYVTTPIYYVNAEPHLGHAYTTLAADILARFHRQKGDDVFFLTGTDEHGNKIAQAAADRGVTPRQHVDELAPKFKDLTRQLNVTNDFFIRTTDPEHERYVQEFVEKLRAAGDIEKRAYGGLYCTACEGFWYERDLVDGKCPDHGIEPTWLEEENYYFKLSAYQDRLSAFFRANPEWVRPKSRYNEALSFIEQGLEDISISRSTLKWGIPVPWDPEQVVYVWIDALVNYLSALTYARPGEDLSRYWPATVHLMAKEILKFHAVIWPAMLMSAGYDLPESEFIHGFLLMGGEKMSKTRGNVLDPFAVMETYGIDALRYYLFREISFGQDGVISLEGFEGRYNSELANELGNLVSRTVSMIAKYRGGAIPAGARGGRRGKAAGSPPWRPPAKPWWPPVRRTWTPSRSRRRSSRCGSSCAASTVWSRRRRPGSWPRTRRRRAASTPCCTAWRPACASSLLPCTPSCRARRWRSCVASVNRTATATCCSPAPPGTV